jgi:hypothetical protein
MHYVNDITLVPKMGQIIKVQRPVSSASINDWNIVVSGVKHHDLSLTFPTVWYFYFSFY